MAGMRVCLAWMSCPCSATQAFALLDAPTAKIFSGACVAKCCKKRRSCNIRATFSRATFPPYSRFGISTTEIPILRKYSVHPSERIAPLGIIRAPQNADIILRVLREEVFNWDPIMPTGMTLLRRKIPVRTPFLFLTAVRIFTVGTMQRVQHWRKTVPFFSSFFLWRTVANACVCYYIICQVKMWVWFIL